MNEISNNSFTRKEKFTLKGWPSSEDDAVSSSSDVRIKVKQQLTKA